MDATVTRCVKNTEFAAVGSHFGETFYLYERPGMKKKSLERPLSERGTRLPYLDSPLFPASTGGKRFSSAAILADLCSAIAYEDL